MLGNSERSSDDFCFLLRPRYLSTNFSGAFVEPVLSGPRASFAENNNRFSSNYDIVLRALKPCAQLNSLRPDVDEKHRNRIESAVGRCQSMAGPVSLVPKQDRVQEAVS
jgi:hypothetical protein